ncbi:MAG: radical SAM protein [Leptospiraceae bacterium]|nr:radical SAM protein [Leptospiraceae bacterium]
MLLNNKEKKTVLDLSRVIFEVSNLCTNHCLYCYNYWKATNEEKPFAMNYSKAIKTLKRLLKLFPVKKITFTGGEPTLADRLPELVFFAKRHGIWVNLITAGGGELSQYENLLYVPPDQFQLPFHSYDPSIHNIMMGNKNSHKIVKEKINFLLSKNQKVAVVIILTKLNINTLEDTLKEIKEMGIRNVLVNRFDPGGTGLKNIDKLELCPIQLNEAYSLLNEFVSLDFLIHSGINTPHCLLNRKKYPKILFGGCKIWEGKGPTTVDVDGNLRLCNQSQHIIGNIHKQSLSDIESHPIFQDWQTSIPEECKECDFFGECRAGCRAAGEQMGLSVYKPDPYMIRFGKNKPVVK